MLFLKTTHATMFFVLDFIVHYLLHVSVPIGGHLQVCTYCLNMATVRNNVFVLDFIVHYLLHVSAPEDLKMATDWGRNM
jgi:uncharacterized membrane protein